MTLEALNLLCFSFSQASDSEGIYGRRHASIYLKLTPTWPEWSQQSLNHALDQYHNPVGRAGLDVSLNYTQIMESATSELRTSQSRGPTDNSETPWVTELYDSKQCDCVVVCKKNFS